MMPVSLAVEQGLCPLHLVLQASGVVTTVMTWAACLVLVVPTVRVWLSCWCPSSATGRATTITGSQWCRYV